MTDSGRGGSAERSLHSLWDHSQAQQDARTRSATLKSLPTIQKARTLAVTEKNDFGPVTNSQVVQTKWHELSDEQIQRTISRYSTPRGPSETPLKPYFAAIRALSVGLHQSLREQETRCKHRHNGQSERAARGQREHTVVVVPRLAIAAVVRA